MPLKPGELSFVPAMLSVDRQNNRIYAMDPGPGKSVGINFNQETGKMTLAWSADQKTQDYMVLIGPANHRVLVGTNILSNVTNPVHLVPGPKESTIKNKFSGVMQLQANYLQPQTTSV